MALLKTLRRTNENPSRFFSQKKNGRGFSLIEILVVMGMLMIVGGFTAAMGYGSFRSGAFYGEQGILISALQKARAAALNNIRESPHGVAVFPALHPGSYVVFEGTSYAAVVDHSKDEVLGSLYPVTVSPGSAEVVFAQLSGNANYSGDIVLHDPVRGVYATTSVNSEGRISR